MYCFIIMPFGEQGSKEEEMFLSVFKYLENTLKQYDASIYCKRSDLVHDTRDKMTTIVEQMYKADFVIADLTNNNPNVFYELGIVHTLGKRSIRISQSQIQKFDIRQYDIVPYKYANIEDKKNDELEKEIIGRVKDIINNPKTSDNPVSDYFQHIDMNISNNNYFESIEDARNNYKRIIPDYNKQDIYMEIMIYPEISMKYNYEKLRDMIHGINYNLEFKYVLYSTNERNCPLPITGKLKGIANYGYLESEKIEHFYTEIKTNCLIYHRKAILEHYEETQGIAGIRLYEFIYPLINMLLSLLYFSKYMNFWTLVNVEIVIEGIDNKLIRLPSSLTYALSKSLNPKVHFNKAINTNILVDIDKHKDIIKEYGVEVVRALGKELHKDHLNQFINELFEHDHVNNDIKELLK